VEITVCERWRRDSNFHSFIFGHTGLGYDTVDTVLRHGNSRRRIPLPVSMAALLNVGSRPTSDNVNRVISESGMVENEGVGRSWNRGAISHRLKVISTSGLVAAISNLVIILRRAMSVVLGTCPAWSLCSTVISISGSDCRHLEFGCRPT